MMFLQARKRVDQGVKADEDAEDIDPEMAAMGFDFNFSSTKKN